MMQQDGGERQHMLPVSDNGQTDGKKPHARGLACGNGRQRQTVGYEPLYGLGRICIADEALHLVHLAILGGIAVMGGMAVIDIAVAAALFLHKAYLLCMVVMGHTRQEQQRERCRPKGEEMESA